MQIDQLDAALIQLLTDEPSLPILECARRLGVARGTVQSRLSRLHANGVIERIAPHVSPAGFGYGLVAFCDVEINQVVGHEQVAPALAGAIPEILEMHTVTGRSDMLLKVVAKDGQDLQRVLDDISRVPGVARTSSSLALQTHLQNRVLPLLHAEVRRIG